MPISLGRRGTVTVTSGRFRERVPTESFFGANHYEG